MLVTRAAAGGPANPQPFTLVQPDGTPFIVRMVGDEWSNAYQTLDGFSVVRDDASGYWFYAQSTADGTLAPTALAAGIDLPVGLIPNARPARAPGAPGVLEVVAPAAVLGTRPLLVILVEFTDKAASTTAAAWQPLFFGASNSVKHHYAVSSFNSVTVAAVTESSGTANDGIVGWLTLPRTHPNTGSSITNANQQLAKDAIVAADPFVDFAAYDANNNGRIAPSELDIIIVAAGSEASFFNSCAPSVWAHKWQVFSVAPPVADGKVVGGDGYAQVGEMHCANTSPPGQQATIGQIAHELGHLYGLPDLYDTDDSSEGVGEWSLMATGSWNRVTRGGDSPSLMDAWSKAVLGWVTPTLVTATRASQPIANAASSPTVFQFRAGTPGSSGEYFLVENRQRVSYDAGLRGSGLVIWHIDEAKATNREECIPGGSPACSSGVHYKVAVIQADNAFHLERGQNRSDAGDPYPGTANNRTFAMTTSPSSRLWSGAASGVTVTDISDSASTMTATLSPGGGPFTDPTLTSAVTPIRAVHIDELRARIDAVRTARGLGTFSWSDPNLTVQGTTVRAVHVMELRSALLEAYAAAGVTPPTFTDTSLAGVVVKAVHLQQLREAVIALE